MTHTPKEVQEWLELGACRGECTCDEKCPCPACTNFWELVADGVALLRQREKLLKELQGLFLVAGMTPDDFASKYGLDADLTDTCEFDAAKMTLIEVEGANP